MYVARARGWRDNACATSGADRAPYIYAGAVMLTGARRPGPLP